MNISYTWSQGIGLETNEATDLKDPTSIHNLQSIGVSATPTSLATLHHASHIRVMVHKMAVSFHRINARRQLVHLGLEIRLFFRQYYPPCSSPSHFSIDPIRVGREVRTQSDRTACFTLLEGACVNWIMEINFIKSKMPAVS